MDMAVCTWPVQFIGILCFILFLLKYIFYQKKYPFLYLLIINLPLKAFLHIRDNNRKLYIFRSLIIRLNSHSQNKVIKYYPPFIFLTSLNFGACVPMELFWRCFLIKQLYN